MYTDLYKNVPDMSKLVDYLNVENVLSATREFVEINARYMGELLDNQVDLANFYVDSGEKVLETAREVFVPSALKAAIVVTPVIVGHGSLSTMESRRPI